MSPASSIESRLAGRERERATLRDAAEQCATGSFTSVLVIGEAGIGKTRLVQQLASDMAVTDARVVWGRAWDEGGAPAFWPWVQVARALGMALGEELGTQSSAGGAELSAPGLSAVSSDGGARVRAFDRFREELTGAASQWPLVVIVEDLHAADEPSLQLFRFLLRNPPDAPVLVVGTARDGVDAGGKSLAGEMSDCTMVLHLDGLDERGVQKLLESLPAAASSPSVQRVLERTGGNPLFITQLVQLPSTDVQHSIPSSVREVIGGRLATLDAPLRALLVTAAVLGRRFRVDSLSILAGIAPAETRALLRVTEASRLVTPESDVEWSFVHDLMRETLLDYADPTEVRAQHLAAAENLASIGAHPSEVALHAWLGGSLSAGPDCENAGDRAFAVFGYEEAASWFERSLESGPHDPGRRVQLLMKSATALHRAGDFEGRRSHALDAARLAKDLGDGATFAKAAVIASGYCDTRFDPERIAVLEEALGGLGNTPSALRARVMCELAQNLVVSSTVGGPDRAEEGRRLSREAVAEARHSNDRGVLGWALFGWHLVLMRNDGSLQERESLARELVEVAAAHQDPDLECISHLWLANDLLAAGRLADFERSLARAEQLASQSRQPFALWTSMFPRAGLELIRGRFDACERLVDEALSAGRRTGFSDVFAVDSSLRLCLAFARGEVPAHLALMGVNLDSPPPPSALDPRITAAALADLGRLEEARQVLAGFSDQGQGLSSWAMSADASWYAHDNSRAAELYELLLPYRDRWAMTLLMFSRTGPVEFHLGQLCGLMGRAEAAREHLARARAQVEAAGAAYLVRRVDEVEARIGGSPASAAAATRRREVADLARHGSDWEVEFQGRRSRVRDSVGMGHLARLLSAPGVEVHSLELASSGAGVVRQDSAGAPLDAQAKSAYRRRVGELEAEIDEARSAYDISRVEALELELDFVVRELKSAVGLGGRDRKPGSSEERARLSVSRAVKRALERLDEVDQNLAGHLRAAVRTGVYCVYQPDPLAEITWDVRV